MAWIVHFHALFILSDSQFETMLGTHRIAILLRMRGERSVLPFGSYAVKDADALSASDLGV